MVSIDNLRIDKQHTAEGICQETVTDKQHCGIIYSLQRITFQTATEEVSLCHWQAKILIHSVQRVTAFLS